MAGHKGIVYILQDEVGKFYIGSTTDLNRRLKQHHYHQTRTTARMKKPLLIFQQEFDSIHKARVIELKLKKLKRKDYLQKIIRDGYIRLAQTI